MSTITKRRGAAGAPARAAGTLLAPLAAALLALALAAPATATDPAAAKRMKKQIGVFERILDQVLIESPNFLVHGRDNARGIYLEEFGVLVAFEASLANKEWAGFGDWMSGFSFKNEDGKIIITTPDKDKKKGGSSEEGEDEEKKIEVEIERRHKAEEGADRRAKAEEEKSKDAERKMYEEGKKEVIDALLEYGDTVTTLRDDQWVAVVAFLRDSDYFLENKISRLLVKARMADLRAYTAGRLSEEEMRAKIVLEES